MTVEQYAVWIKTVDNSTLLSEYLNSNDSWCSFQDEGVMSAEELTARLVACGFLKDGEKA
jgi:hypothetical protein